MEEKYKALAELLKDEETAKEVLSESVEETQANLKAKGLDFTVEELLEIAKAQLPKGELDEGSLDDVNGGFFLVDQCFDIGIVNPYNKNKHRNQSCPVPIPQPYTTLWWKKNRIF